MNTPSDKTVLGQMETIKHIHRVRHFLFKMIEELDMRARSHDLSKLQSPEAEIFGEWTPELAKVEYMSPEYKELMEKVRPAIDHHYANNRHHPEWIECQELWKSVVGYEGHYEVSNLGRVRSLNRVVPRSGPTNATSKQGSLRKAHITPKGYARLQLAKDGDTQNYMVHRLVAEAFIPNPFQKPLVNHKNGVKTDNRVDNLEWATDSENQIHAYETGLRKPSIKYVVKCVELDIVTEGIDRMERELRARGYDRACSGAICRCINDSGQSKHLDLTFEGWPIAELGDISFVDSMTLCDLVEMLCDWKAATERNKNGNIRTSIEKNTGRYNMSPQLAQIMQNTVREMFQD